MTRGWTTGVLSALIALVVLGSIGAILLGRAIVDDYEADHDKDAPAGTREGYYAFSDIRAGDCALDWDDNDWGAEVVPCTDDHAYEFFANVKLKDGTWPGQNSIDLRAEKECDKHLAKRLGRPVDFDKDYYEYLSPREQGWPEDRHVLCMLLADGTPRIDS